jgi:hypothetical protein
VVDGLRISTKADTGRLCSTSTRHEARDKILFVEVRVLPADGMSAAAEKEK